MWESFAWNLDFERIVQRRKVKVLIRRKYWNIDFLPIFQLNDCTAHQSDANLKMGFWLAKLHQNCVKTRWLQNWVKSKKKICDLWKQCTTQRALHTIWWQQYQRLNLRYCQHQIEFERPAAGKHQKGAWEFANKKMMKLLVSDTFHMNF